MNAAANLEPHAYTYAQAATMCAISKETLQRAIADGNLNPVYPTKARISARILAPELARWVATWPDTYRE